MGAVMVKEMFFNMTWKSIEHLIDMKWFYIPVLRTVCKDDFSLDFFSIKKVVSVMPKLVIIPSFTV